MKPAEKMKRIKLISEKMFAEGVDNPQARISTIEAYSKRCITAAKIFVEEFEKFENEFLKEHEVKNEQNTDSLKSKTSKASI